MWPFNGLKRRGGGVSVYIFAFLCMCLHVPAQIPWRRNKVSGEAVCLRGGEPGPWRKGPGNGDLVLHTCL